MNEENFLANQKFKVYWNMQDKRQKMILRKKIMVSCYINYPTVNNWLQNRCKIPELAKNKIEECIGKKIFSES